MRRDRVSRLIASSFRGRGTSLWREGIPGGAWIPKKGSPGGARPCVWSESHSPRWGWPLWGESLLGRRRWPPWGESLLRRSRWPPWGESLLKRRSTMSWLRVHSGPINIWDDWERPLWHRTSAWWIAAGDGHTLLWWCCLRTEWPTGLPTEVLRSSGRTELLEALSGWWRESFDEETKGPRCGGRLWGPAIYIRSVW